MLLERRALLRAGTAGLLTVALPGLARAAAPAVRKLKLENIHTGEKLTADYCVNGCYDPSALKAINHVLRDHRNGEVHDIDPRLLDLLADLNTKLETPAGYQVISGYRSPQSNAAMHDRSSGVAKKSLHMQGMAMDIRVPGRALQAVHDNARAMARGGVGMYPTSNFVHVDVGRVRYWSGA